MAEKHREWGRKGGKTRSGLKGDLTWAYRHLGDAKLEENGEVVLPEGIEPPSIDGARAPQKGAARSGLSDRLGAQARAETE